MTTSPSDPTVDPKTGSEAPDAKARAASSSVTHRPITHSQRLAANQLAAIAAGLCQDAGIGLEVHQGGWAFDTVRRVILVSAKALAEDGPEVCAGILAHEVGHYFISRYTWFALEHLALPSIHLLLNGIEDPRVNRWMPTRYPGSGPWLQAVYAHESRTRDKAVTAPDFILFCLECAMEESRDWQPAPESTALSARLVAALDETRAARRSYAEDYFPEPDLDPSVFEPGLMETWLEQVEPALRTTTRGFLPTAEEQGIQLLSLAALELAIEEIIPVAHRLYAADIDRIQRHLEQNSAAERRARQAISDKDLAAARGVISEAMRGEPNPGEKPSESASRRREAEALLEIYAQGIVRPPLIKGRPRRGRPDGRSDLPVHPNSPLRWPERAEDAYERARKKVADQVERLVGALERALRPRKRLGLQSGYPSGFRMDMRQLMAFEADPRRYNELWVRKSIPDRRDAAISLLVDLSGSMRGEKSEAALLGTVLLAETLSRVGVPFAIHGFQDVLVSMASFGEGLSRKAQRAIGEIPQEINGTREGGNNQPGYNDDGPCLEAAAEDLLRAPAIDRLLIVVSDGLPEGRHSDRDDLNRAIQRLVDPRVPLSLIGVGLGPDTGHVVDFYPRSRADVPLVKFAEVIGGLIREALLGPDEEGGRSARRS
ncbi:MAG: cobaltochelatase CobT-related protein [Bradymonadia bacterium]